MNYKIKQRKSTGTQIEVNNMKLNSKAAATYSNELQVTGTIYDFNESLVWIETESDMYVCPIEALESIKEELPKHTARLEYSAGKMEDFDYIDKKNGDDLG